MKVLKTVIVMCLGLVVVSSSTMAAKSTGQLIQEGLYQEEMEGNLGAAIKIYEEIIKDRSAKDGQVAQAMYRLGMCYIKQQNETMARTTLTELVDRFPSQGEIINKAQSLLADLVSPDPAELMPPDIKVYVEFGSPGKQVETILNMLKGTPLENPLAAMGTAGWEKSPSDIIGALLNPSMMAEFKKIRGMAIGISEIKDSPSLIGILFPGKSDALKGMIMAGLGMAGQPGESIEGMQTFIFSNQGGAVYDDTVIIVGQPMELVIQAVRKYKGMDHGPSLASENKAFARLNRKERENNTLTVWVDVDRTVANVKEQFGYSIPPEFYAAEALGDIHNIDDAIAYLSIEEQNITLEGTVWFKDGHNCLPYKLIRTSSLTRAGFEAVPAEAVGLVSLALSDAEPQQVARAHQAIKDLTGLDIGREIFANIEQITLFVLPLREAGEDSVWARKVSPVVARVGVAITSHNPAQTQQLLSQLLSIGDTAIRMALNNEQRESMPDKTAQGQYLTSFFDGEVASCYLAQAGQSNIITMTPSIMDLSKGAVKSGKSVIKGGPLQEALNQIPADTCKLVLVDVGGAMRLIDTQINHSVTSWMPDERVKPAAPESPVMKIAEHFDGTSVQFRTVETVNQCSIRLSVNDLPPLGDVINNAMQIMQAQAQAEAEARLAREQEELARAKCVYPPDGSVVKTDMTQLKWEAGEGAVTHQLYFGTSEEAIEMVTEQEGTQYELRKPLKKDTEYFWRVDEVQEDGTIKSGNMWKFNTSARLIGWWKLDETSDGIARDSSGEDNSANLVNGPMWQPDGGRHGGALLFDGIDDYIKTETNYKLQISGDYTISLWIKADPYQKMWAGVVTKSNSARNMNQYTLQFSGEEPRTLIVNQRDNMWDTGLTPDKLSGRWHCISIVRKGDTMTSYLNGKEFRSGTLRTPPIGGEGFLVIGGERTTTSSYVFKGTIDDVRIYNYALSAEDVAAIYEEAP
ncbi:MAG: tetratricopeptide repeat protein [Sedimentisphaerales bacterium]|nr:tetratricopeptide repeat protein [Sedimentisphaerales bacterium]